MERSRIAGAPISWGVCEVPGWGHQLTPARVLTEMRALGLSATEFGPADFLPAEPQRRTDLLAEHNLAPVGGFVPVVLHEDGGDPRPQLEPLLLSFAKAGAPMVVLAASTGADGYDGRPVLDAAGWRRLCTNLDRIARAAAAHGLQVSLHPHVGTMVEQGAEVTRVLDGSDVGLCLDTGHLMVGGTDPLTIARSAADRVTHVHLKDVAAAAARSVAEGSSTYTAMVAAGMYRPLGQGDVDIAGVVAALEGAGYRGWYVLEQDTVLSGEPPPSAGPVEDVRASIDYLTGLPT